MDKDKNTCILTTKMAMKVLNHYGVEVEPRAVKLYFYNLKYTEAQSRGDGPPPLPIGSPQLEEWHKRTGGFAVASQDHLVVGYKNSPRIIDCSSDQFSYPEHDIVMPYVVDCEMNVLMATETGVRFIYQEEPGDKKWYRETEAWDSEKSEKVADYIAEEVIAFLSLLMAFDKTKMKGGLV